MYNLIANCKCCGEFASASLLQYFRESSSEYSDNQYTYELSQCLFDGQIIFSIIIGHDMSAKRC